MFFGRDDNRRDYAAGSRPSERNGGYRGLEVPSGPGTHGFSSRHPLGASDPVGERGGPAESDAAPVTNRFGYDESEPSDLSMGSDIERLAEAVDRLNEAGEEDMPAVAFPEPASVQELVREPESALEPVREPRGEAILIIHHNEQGGLKVDSFGNEAQARDFVEALLRQGVDRETIEAYRASRLDFSVSFKPVVPLQRSVDSSRRGRSPPEA